MHFQRLNKVAGWALGLALILGSAPAWAQTGGLEGKCTGENGEPLVNYIVLIERTDVRQHYKTKTNKKGEYMHIGLPIGDYQVSLQTPTDQTVLYFKTRIGMGDNTKLDFDLAKEKKLAAESEKKRIEANPELKRQSEEQTKEAKQYTGLKELFDQAAKLSDQKMYAEAIPLYEQALPLAKTTNIPIVLGRLAEAYHKTKNYPKAIETYEKAMAANPTEATYHNNLGNVYADMGKTEEAAAEFKKAAEMDPARASSYYFNYGVVMYNQGKMDEAVGAFQKAVQIDPNYADGQFMLGQSLMGKLNMDPNTGKIIPAPGTVEALEAYLKLEPTGKHAGEAQSMLQTLQGSVETTYKKPKKSKG
ncbi:MAG: tetratricopeptide repeat protein [Acidobacteria bacterium]|nr:tetratricopeptide repeat protein [Acidobacteriota bacterium]